MAITNPTPRQVLRRTRRLSPVDHDTQATALFAGTPVQWPVRFFGSVRIFDTGQQFSFVPRGFFTGSKLVYARISLDLNPELRTLRRSQRLNLSGTILSVDQFLGITVLLDRAEVFPMNLVDRIIGFFNRGPN